LWVPAPVQKNSTCPTFPTMMRVPKLRNYGFGPLQKAGESRKAEKTALTHFRDTHHMNDRWQSDKSALAWAITKRPSRLSVCQLNAGNEVALLWMQRSQANQTTLLRLLQCSAPLLMVVEHNSLTADHPTTAHHPRSQHFTSSLLPSSPSTSSVKKAPHHSRPHWEYHNRGQKCATQRCSCTAAQG